VIVYDVQRYPDGVYPGEVDDECPEARAIIDVLISRMRSEGCSPEGYASKALGKRMAGLWQINLRAQKRQVRILYAPYDQLSSFSAYTRKDRPRNRAALTSWL
jgi:hypothetical protein